MQFSIVAIIAAMAALSAANPLKARQAGVACAIITPAEGPTVDTCTASGEACAVDSDPVSIPPGSDTPVITIVTGVSTS